MLTPEKLQAISAHINAKWKDKACQLCKANDWTVNGYVNLSLADTAGAIFGGPVMPMIAVACTNCGNTIMVNSLIAGAAPPKFGEPLAGSAHSSSESSADPGNGGSRG